MKYTLSGIVFFAVVVAGFAQGVSARGNAQLRKDSLNRVIASTQGAERNKARTELSRLYLGEVHNEGVLDTLFTLYDQIDAFAREEGDAAGQGVARYNRLGAYLTLRQFEDVIREAPAALEFMARNELWKHYNQTYTLLIDSYRRSGQGEMALEVAKRAYDDAKARDDRPGMGMLQYAISRIYIDQRRFADGESCVRECIDLLQDQTAYLNFLSTAYNTLMMCLIAQERYDEAEKVIGETEAVNRRYEEASHSRQPSAWYNLWLKCTDLYRQTNQFDKAQVYVDKIDSVTRGKVKMFKERGHILYGKGRYAEALEMFDKEIEASPNTLESKALKLMTLAQMREPEKAVQLFSDVVGELENRHNEAYNAQLDQIKTQYEVDKHIAEKERNRNYFLFALGGCLLLFVLLSVTFYYNRVVMRKNIGLYKQIKEQDRLEEELVQLRMQALLHSGDKASGGEETQLPGDWQQRELVERLHEYLLRDRNLVHADQGRDEIVTALGTNKNTLTDAVKTVTGKTPMEYIRTMQLEEARRLLDKHPELTIEAVAYDCGFNAPNTFYRLFRKHYGISPAEYRKAANTLGKS